MRILFVLLMALSFITCKKEEDGRDQYVGEYVYTFTYSGQDVDGSYSFTGSGTMNVTKGPGGGEYILLDDDGTIYRAISLGDPSEFNIVKDVIRVDTDAFEITGNGLFSANKMQMTLQGEAVNYYDEFTISMQGEKN